jgi:acyl-homoserine-lactone acylase
MFNVGYADRQGNTWYVFDGRIPIRPPGFDWAGAVPGNTSRTEWFAMRPLYELPQLRNPKSGYIQNCNDAPWFTNLEERIDPASYASYLKQPAELNWRTQISLRILSHERELTLERMIQHKFNAELPYAERVKADLLPLARARDEAPVRQAADVLASWDNRTDADSRGAVLFLAWQEEYSKVAPTLYATAWSAANPLQTPTGLANPSAAVDALARAAANVQEHYGALDVPWGDVHRLRRGSLDLPIGGTPWTLHNARYRRDLDRKLVIGGGDTYILLVEFGDEGPRAFSVIPYSESANPASPHYNDQGPLYAADRLKPAWFSEADITANTLRRYQPHAAPPSTSSSARQPAPRADRARARS